MHACMHVFEYTYCVWIYVFVYECTHVEGHPYSYFWNHLLILTYFRCCGLHCAYTLLCRHLGLGNGEINNGFRFNSLRGCYYSQNIGMMNWNLVLVFARHPTNHWTNYLLSIMTWIWESSSASGVNCDTWMGSRYMRPPSWTRRFGSGRGFFFLASFEIEILAHWRL
jgi:hypothetical protein